MSNEQPIFCGNSFTYSNLAKNTKDLYDAELYTIVGAWKTAYILYTMLYNIQPILYTAL